MSTWTQRAISTSHTARRGWLITKIYNLQNGSDKTSIKCLLLMGNIPSEGPLTTSVGVQMIADSPLMTAITLVRLNRDLKRLKKWDHQLLTGEFTLQLCSETVDSHSV